MWGRIVGVALAIFSASGVNADESFDYKPVVNGTIRSRWEMETQEGESRFQVRNARVSLTGHIAPEISYFINTDLCDRGKMKILDAWGRFDPGDGIALQGGQFRMPFGMEPFRAPHTYIFANRSFIGKQVCNYRAVGAKLSCTAKSLSVEAGVFNPTTIGDHETWNKKVNASGRIIYTSGGIRLATGAMTVMADSVRANLLDGAISWNGGHWTIEGEYMYEHFTHDAYKPTNAYCVFADYRMPVKAGVFNRLSFQGRFDGMTRHINSDARNRATAGVTLTYVRGGVFADVRANYEKYFYRHGHRGPQGERDKAVLEMVIRF